jgi:transcriptional regulator with PAS, ATPase and Fis domain
MENHKFRKDLFYRLNVIPIYIPPLRERQKDIIPLARHLLNKMTRAANRPPMDLEKNAAKELKNYSWPGNARELSNVLERAMYSSSNNTIYKGDLPFNMGFGPRAPGKTTKSTLKSAQNQAQAKAIYQALAQTNYNKVKASKLLGIHRTLLYKKMKEYNIGLAPE